MKKIFLISVLCVLVSACIQGTTARQIAGILLRNFVQQQLMNSEAVSVLAGSNKEGAVYELQNDLYNERLPESIELECYEHETDEQCVDRNKSQVESNVSSQINLQAFNEAYDMCHNSINENPSIDLDDHIKIYDEMVSCLYDRGFVEEVKILTKYK